MAFSQKLLFAPIVSVLIALPQPLNGVAQEILTIQSKTSEQPSKRRGQILDWQGNVIAFDSGSRKIEIDSSTVIELETDWPAGTAEARQLLAQRRLREALERFESAQKLEQRTWARHMILAEQIQCLTALEQYFEAAQKFRTIVEADPQTRFFHLIPLAWDSIAQPVHPEFANWMDSPVETARLIGASRSLVGPSRKQAIETLERLRHDATPNVAMLAASQLWRTDAGADQQAIERWKMQLERTPKSLRCGPYFVLGTALATQGQTDEAVLYLMRLPIIYPRNESLAATALVRSAILLKEVGQSEQATTLLREILRNYPDSTWAARATELMAEQSNTTNSRDTDD